MENKTQNKQNKGGDERQESPKYHFFISYRHLPSNDPKDSPSTARSIAQALEIERFKVFFDCSKITRRGKEFEFIKDSKCILVLITKDSLETVKEHSFENVDKNKSGHNGYNFAKELHEIEERLKSNNIKSEDVFLLNINNQCETLDILNTFKSQGYEQLSETEVIPFLNGNIFDCMIKYLIYRFNRDEETSYYESIKEYKAKSEEYKAKSEKYKTKYVFAIVAAAIAIAIAIVFGFFNAFGNKESTTISELNNKISSQNFTIDSLRDSLSKYENEFIIFAGGGTVQQYLQKTANEYRDSIDINDYPFSKYVHMPSSIAWHLLFDDVNDGDHSYYCPIILSAGEIDTTGDNIKNFTKENSRRIAAYLLDTVPLIVQFYNKGNNNTKTDTMKITLNELKDSLNKANKYRNEYEIWTTTEKSGTYLEYKKLLDDTLGFNLDDIVNNQPGKKRHDFNPNYLTVNNKAIVLANRLYFHEKRKPTSVAIVCDKEGNTKNIPLYVYAVAKTKEGHSTCEIKRSEAKKFLQIIGWDTSQQLYLSNDPIIHLDPKKKFRE